MGVNFTDNSESIIHHLVDFAHQIETERNKDSDVNPYEVAKRYVNNEIAMEKGMAEYYEYLKTVDRYNSRILKAIKSVRGKSFYKNLLGVMEDCDGVEGKMEIVPTPIGKFQKENHGRGIKGIWCWQQSVGDSGDSWEGQVCVQIKENKFLKFNFSM